MPPNTSSPGRHPSSAINVDDFPSPPRLTSSHPGGATAEVAIDVDKVGAGYTPPARQPTRVVDPGIPSTSSSLSEALRSAAMDPGSDSDDTEDRAPANDPEAEDRLRRLAAYTRLLPHVLLQPRNRRVAARGAAVRSRFINALQVAADDVQAEETAEELRLARGERAARAQEARDLRTVLDWSRERRLTGLAVFSPWKEANAYLTAAHPPDSPLNELVDPDLACTICAEVLSHPVMTSCTHVFCFVCLRSNMEISIQCPICREVQSVAPAPCLPFNRVLDYAIQKRYPGWQDDSSVRLEFVNIGALNGGSLV
ncbi:hypothetical protein C8F01DRAFT_1254933 [Mycena amicta]|nr:hypothetical protein C8F01DRAFT_1254933 [Mycena amicta]